jgi:glycosyltransferase involved in cell wall biosynthesis
MTRRIFLLGDSLKIGGTEGQFAEMACGLDRSRWEVDVSCLRAEGPLRARLEAAGIRPWSCGSGSLKSPRAALSVLRLARHLRRRRIDVVHSFDFYSNVLGVPAARLARVPVVIASQRDLGDLRAHRQRLAHRVALRLADHVLVNSRAVADRLEQERTLPADRVVLIPNGVDAARFRPAADRRPVDSGPITVGTLANLRPEKGVADIVHAAAIVREQCANVRFAIIGDGPLRADLEWLIRAHHLEQWVELRGATTDPAAALRELDVFVLASHSEACSNGLLEAMATGLAVVATNVGGNPCLVDDERTGLLVPPADPVGLAKAIVRLVEEPALAAQFGARALDRVAEFSVARMLAALEAFYDRTLSGGHPRCGSS